MSVEKSVPSVPAPMAGFPYSKRTTVRFWRDVNSNGHNLHAILFEFEAPEGMCRQDAIAQAKMNLCYERHATSWRDCAHGFDVLSSEVPGDATP